MTSGDPQSWARAVENLSLRISEVERIVFRAHPEVIQAIDADEADDHAPRRGSAWMWILVGLVPLFAPILGVAIYGQHSYLDLGEIAAETSVPVSGVSFIVTVLCQLVFAVVWIRQGAMWSPWLMAYGAFTAVLGGFASIGIPNVAASQGYDLGAWRWPSLVAVVIGTVLVIAVLLRRGARGGVSVGATGWKRVRQTVNAIPAPERKSLRAERNAAVDILRDRGVLDDIRAQTARGSELGRFHRLETIWKELDERSECRR